MSETGLMERTRSQLLLIDMQERLMPAMAEPHETTVRACVLAQAARRLSVPTTATEQYPRGLGPTVAPVREALGNDAVVLPKLSFSSLADEAIARRLADTPLRRQLVLAGVEAHVCVLQSALGALAQGFEVFVVRDAVSSRQPASVDAAVGRLLGAGAGVVTTEMVLFEWLGAAGTDEFKAVSALIR